MLIEPEKKLATPPEPEKKLVKAATEREQKKLVETAPSELEKKKPQQN
jgi:hypothetical protein